MTAGGQPACAPAPTLSAPDRYDDGIAQALVALLGRRRLMQAAAGGVATLLLAACGSGGQGSTAASSSGGSGSAASTSAAATSSAASASAATASSAASTASATASTTSGASTSTPAASSATASSSAASSASAASSSAASTGSASAASGQAPWVYVFNVGSKDVSIIDSATNKVLSTKSLGASVRWLSNEQTYWDGSHIWTYDFPDNKLHAIAIDPKAMTVAQTIDTGTTGPGHSLMLTPDKTTAFLNAGGSNVVNVIDVKSGQVTDKIDTGKFP